MDGLRTPRHEREPDLRARVEKKEKGKRPVRVYACAPHRVSRCVHRARDRARGMREGQRRSERKESTRHGLCRVSEWNESLAG